MTPLLLLQSVLTLQLALALELPLEYKLLLVLDSKLALLLQLLLLLLMLLFLQIIACDSRSFLHLESVVAEFRQSCRGCLEVLTEECLLVLWHGGASR